MTDISETRQRLLKDIPKRSWILEEFDESFNRMVVAAMRWKMEWHDIGPERRAHFNDLIERLSEPYPEFTDEEMAQCRDLDDRLKDDGNGFHRLLPSTDAEKAVYRAYEAREDAYNERIRAARHEVVDLMGELWT